MRTRPLLVVSAALIAMTAPARSFSAEVRPTRLAKYSGPDYRLPDPLRCADGTAVEDPDSWERKRRPELLEIFSREVYGRTPAGWTGELQLETRVDAEALGGRATRKEITVWFARDRSGPPMHILLYVPNDAPRPRPLFVGLNFYGNHTVHADPGITLPQGWVPARAPGAVDHRATDAGRGAQAERWQIETVLARGYATATVYCGDLCPDHPEGLAQGVNGWLAGTGIEDRAPDAWGALGVWAWGLSRVLDALAEDPDVAITRAAVHGHSRLGKAALWAGAQDTRFALVISNDSGCGGAALSKRIHGETVAAINQRFPHWFARNFRAYDDNESALPVDQHQLLALIAPRALHVASAEEDDWADPRGEFLAVRAAEPVWGLWKFSGVGVEDVPPVHEPVGDRLRYHIRAGAHDITAYDWACYLDTADRWLK